MIVKRDVEGAPVKIGQEVTIASDLLNDTIDRRFLGRTGVVKALVYDDPREQYPADPLIRVHVRGLGEDLFFSEELELEAWARRRLAQLRSASREQRVAPSTGSRP
jgi:hypothetical protein